jgi:hypothetical protein
MSFAPFLFAVGFPLASWIVGCMGRREGRTDAGWIDQHLEVLMRRLFGARFVGTVFEFCARACRSATQSGVRRVEISEEAFDPSRGIPQEQAFEASLDALVDDLGQLAQISAMLQVPFFLTLHAGWQYQWYMCAHTTMLCNVRPACMQSLLASARRVRACASLC